MQSPIDLTDLTLECRQGIQDIRSILQASALIMEIAHFALGFRKFRLQALYIIL